MTALFEDPQVEGYKFRDVILLMEAALTLVNTYTWLEIPSIQEETSDQDILPDGVPEKYGATMGISYQDVSRENPEATEEAIEKLAEFDRKIEIEEMNQEELQRYISVSSRISCEYCCDAPAIINEEGEKACACEHSYAMRGLAKYLVTEYSEEFNEEDILEEISKWKIRFFPDQHIQKAEIFQEEDIKVNPINLASNKYRGIQFQTQEQQTGMVGSC